MQTQNAVAKTEWHNQQTGLHIYQPNILNLSFIKYKYHISKFCYI